MSQGYFYIASPYTHSDPTVRQARYEMVRDFTAFLSTIGIYGFSPITHSHDMALCSSLPYTFEFWDDWNRVMINASRGIIVHQLMGWAESRGVAAEIEYAKSIGKPIFYFPAEE